MREKTIVILRILMGWILFQGGIEKVLDPSWSAKGFLLRAIPENNPFPELWPYLAGNTYINILVAWGLTLTGIGLILGALVKWNSFWASVMMLSFWAAGLYGGLLKGLPLEHGWFVDEHIVYVAVLITLNIFKAGKLFGLDKYLAETPLAKKYKWAKYFFD